MKKLSILFLCSLLLASSFTSCGGGAKESGSAAPAEITDTAACVTETESETKEKTVMKKSIKILEIGNSFGYDGVAQLYPILQHLGYEEIIIGALHYSSCTLYQHVGFATGEQPVYYYYKTDNGEWTWTENRLMSDAIKDEDWDYVTLMEHSSDAGFTVSYERFLPTLIKYVKERLTNPECKMFWYMPWASREGCPEAAAFMKYDNDQMKMYHAIVSAVSECIVGNKEFCGIIPAGTVVQNLRTTKLCDQLERDNFHLSIPLGRYAASCAFACVLTGCSPEDITFYPKKRDLTYPGKQEIINDEKYQIVIKAVAAALNAPFEITDIE